MRIRNMVASALLGLILGFAITQSFSLDATIDSAWTKIERWTKIEVENAEKSSSANARTDHLLTAFDDVWPTIINKYVEKIPDTEEAKYACFLKSLMGGVSLCLNDPHSIYFTPEAYSELKTSFEGEFGGVGLELASDSNRVIVVDPLKGTPASDSKAFLTGDIIAEVDGENVIFKSLSEIVKKVRGTVGTPVTIRVRRGGQLQKPVKLTRANVVAESVKSEVIDEKTFYIDISDFSDNTQKEFFRSVYAFKKSFGKGAGIVLDVRSNPGGNLDVVQDISILFATVPADDLITTLAGRGEPEETRVSDVLKRYGPSTAEIVGMLRDVPTVVLVNSGTASAAEILAGIIRDYKGSPLVGEKTYGKGSVQTILPLHDGVLKLTIAEYFIGNKQTKVNKVGLEPDYWVENTAPARHDFSKGKPPLIDLKHDSQLKKAVEVLRGQIGLETE